MATSSRRHGHMDGMRKRFAMLQALRDDPQCEHLRPKHRFVPAAAIGQDASQLGHLGYPAAILFQLGFDSEIHGAAPVRGDDGESLLLRSPRHSAGTPLTPSPPASRSGGFIGQLFKTIGKHVPPPAGARSPALWGSRPRIAELFEPHTTSVKSAQRNYVFRYRSPEHWLEVFRTFYGPVHKTFGALAPSVQEALQSDLIALIGQFNRSGDSNMVVPSEYREIVITRH